MSHFRGEPLPTFAVPKSYDLSLTPNLIAGSFAGTVAIDVVIVQETRWIVLNGVNLSVDDASVSFTPRDSPEVLLLRIKQFDESEIVVFEFREFLPKGEAVLRLEFKGELSDDTTGFCRRSFEDNGEKKHMAISQFEPANARRCFPCWDEPTFKATFKITLQVQPDLVALSNMPVLDKKVNGNLKIVSYHESPIMSTYMVAIAVGLFDCLEDQTSDDQANIALHVGLKTLDLFKEYFAAPYPLPKLDMIAVPDFAAGSTEVYGLIAYLEASLLYHEQPSAASNDPGLGAAPDSSSQMNQFLQILGLYFNPRYTEKIKGLKPELQSMTLKPEFFRLRNCTEAMQQMVTLQKALFSGYWHTSSKAREENGATTRSGTRNDAEEMKIFSGDVVMNLKTRGVGVVSTNERYVFPIAEATAKDLQKDDYLVVSRQFKHGENICSSTDKRKLGVICGIETRVDLAASTGEITHQDIGTSLLERIRSFFVGDLVISGSWLGIVEDVELSINLQFENGEKLTNADPDPKTIKPIFTNGVEELLNEPYYEGQEVVWTDWLKKRKVKRGHVLRHGMNSMRVNWKHTTVPGSTKPFDRVGPYDVERFHCSSFSETDWKLGQRCVFEGQNFVIAGLRRRVTVKWDDGVVQQIDSPELVSSEKGIFIGQFVWKGDTIGFVRRIVDRVVWVKWFSGEMPELLYSCELQRDYTFNVLDPVVLSASKTRGFVIGLEEGRLEIEWEDHSISIVSPEEDIKKLFEDSDEDEDEDDDEDGSDGSDGDDDPPSDDE